MKHLTALAILPSLILALCSSVSGQTPKPPPAIDYPVRVEYDRFADKTSITLEYMRVQGEMYDGLEMALVTSHSGQKKVWPIGHAALSILSMSKDWRYLDAPRTLRIIADGERIDLGEMERRSSKVRSGYVMEFLGMIVPTETLSKIANAKKVEMQLGRIEFELKPEMLRYMKEFVKLLSP